MAKQYVLNEDAMRRVSKAVRAVEGSVAGDMRRMSAPPNVQRLASITFRNGSDETIPAYAVMQIDDAEEFSNKEPIVVAVKPTSDGKVYAVNGDLEVKAGNFGQCHLSGTVRVLFDSADGEPSSGDVLGPTTDKWTAAAGKPLLTAMGVLTDGVMLATINVPGSIIPFGAKTSGGPGDSATGWRLTWNADSGDYDDPDFEADTDLTLMDVQNCHRWVGHDDAGDGAYSIGHCDPNGGIVSVHEQARRIKAQANGAISGSTGNIDNITVLDGGVSPGTSLTGINNPLGHYYADNAVVYLTEDGDGSYNLEPMKQMTFRGTLSGSLSQGGSASASLTGPGTVTVYDCLMKSGATAIASGKKIVAVWMPGDSKYYVTEAECP